MHSANRRAFLAALASMGVTASFHRDSFGDTASEPIPLPPRSRFHLYILAGQSNMAGRGPLDADARVAPPRVLKFTADQAWAPATDPLHFDRPAIVGVGLGTSFGRAMAEADPEATIGLIPCAVGGSPLQRWERDGDLFQEAVRRSVLAMKSGTLRGILWHQGENDALAESTARNYAERLSRTIFDLRRALAAPADLPFVAGELGTFLAERQKDGQEAHWKTVNAQLASLKDRIPGYALVESNGLGEKGDGVHFDTKALREFGRRYAREMLRLHAGKPSPLAHGKNQVQ